MCVRECVCARVQMRVRVRVNANVRVLMRACMCLRVRIRVRIRVRRVHAPMPSLATDLEESLLVRCCRDKQELMLSLHRGETKPAYVCDYVRRGHL
jgi:hypothetical protein